MTAPFATTVRRVGTLAAATTTAVLLAAPVGAATLGQAQPLYDPSPEPNAWTALASQVTELAASAGGAGVQLPG